MIEKFSWKALLKIFLKKIVSRENKKVHKKARASFRNRKAFNELMICFVVFFERKYVNYFIAFVGEIPRRNFI